MLSRYTMYRGARPEHDPMPDGVRQDARRHTRHCLRPPGEAVDAFLEAPSAASWTRLAAAYRAEVGERYAADPAPFRALAELAAGEDVYLGCSCPTRNQPDVMRCHTMLALRFMKRRFPKLHVVIPEV